MFKSVSENAGVESVSTFQSAPQTVIVVAALQSIAAQGRFQICDSGRPKTRKTRWSADAARIALAVAFIAVCSVIGNESCANGFDCPEPAEAEQERGCVSVLRLPVQPGKFED
jgi:hypothetical protein